MLRITLCSLRNPSTILRRHITVVGRPLAIHVADTAGHGAERRVKPATPSHHRTTTTTTTATAKTAIAIATPHRTPCHRRHHQCRFSSHSSSSGKVTEVTASDIIDFCTSQGISNMGLRQQSQHVVIKECPFCEKPTNNLADNQHKIYIKIGDGVYFCHRCGAKGSWNDFKRHLGGDAHDNHDEDAEAWSETGHITMRPRIPAPARGYDRSMDTPGTAKSLPMPSEKLNSLYITSLLDQPTSNDSLEYLTKVRGFTTSTLRKYGVGRGTYNFPGQDGRFVPAECVTFPWILPTDKVMEQEELRGCTTVQLPTTQAFVTRRIKARALENKAWQRLDPPGGGWGLFGYHTIPEDATEVVVTEGEYDAMAVYQATGKPAVSLPNGCRSLPVEVMPLLERFEKIYLWMDNDGPGQEGCEKFAEKFGIKRCFLVNPSCNPAPKDANEALQMGLDLNKMLQDAHIMEHEYVVDFKGLRAQVMTQILNPDKYTGVACQSLPGLTSIVKGFRRGEMTVITGPTGSGKTTLLSQLSIDFAEQGISTLWGSFEIKNTRLIHKMLQQFARVPLTHANESEIEELMRVADDFESLPLHFLKFHGGSDIDEVIGAMDYATYVHDVEHVILDNMQFMINRKQNSKSYDKFETQDMAVEKFRKFATEKNIHVTLVVHPRKEDEGAKLGISSIYGSAKATQEADLVLIVQSDGKRKFVEVKKNRYDGTLGYCPLFFDRDSGRYLEQPPGDHKPQAPQLQGFKAKSAYRQPEEQKLNGTSNSDHWASMLAP